MSIQWSGADRGIQEFLIGKGLGGGGGEGLVQKDLLN